MKKYTFKAFLAIGFLMILSAVSINAQTNLIGKYDYKDATTEGNQMNSSLEIKSKNIVIFKYISTADDHENEERAGVWAYDKAKKLLTVTFPAVADNQIKGDDRKQIYTFKMTGKNLKFVKSLYEDDLVGDVYKRT